MASNLKKTVKFAELESNTRVKKSEFPKETKTSRGRKKFVKFRNCTNGQKNKNNVNEKVTRKVAAPRFIPTPRISLMRGRVPCKTPANTPQENISAAISAKNVVVSVGDTPLYTNPKSASVDSKTAKVVTGLHSWLAKRGRPYLFTTLGCAASDLSGRLQSFQAGAKRLAAAPETNAEKEVQTERLASTRNIDSEKTQKTLTCVRMNTIDSINDSRVCQIPANLRGSPCVGKRSKPSSSTHPKRTSPGCPLNSRALRELDASKSLAEARQECLPATISGSSGTPTKNFCRNPAFSKAAAAAAASCWKNDVFDRSSPMNQQDTYSPCDRLLQHAELQSYKTFRGYRRSLLSRGSPYVETYSSPSIGTHMKRTSPECPHDSMALKELNTCRSLAGACQECLLVIKSGTSDISSKNLSRNDFSDNCEASGWRNEVFDLNGSIDQLDTRFNQNTSLNQHDINLSFSLSPQHAGLQAYKAFGGYRVSSVSRGSHFVEKRLEPTSQAHLKYTSPEHLLDSKSKESAILSFSSTAKVSINSSFSLIDVEQIRPATPPPKSPDSRFRTDDFLSEENVSPTSAKTSKHAKALENLLNLTDSGFSPTASRDWLSVMLSLYPEIRDEPLYWKCLSSIEKLDLERLQMENDTLECRMDKLGLDSPSSKKKKRRVLGELTVDNFENPLGGKYEEEKVKRKARKTAFHSAYFDEPNDVLHP